MSFLVRLFTVVSPFFVKPLEWLNEYIGSEYDPFSMHLIPWILYLTGVILVLIILPLPLNDLFFWLLIGSWTYEGLKEAEE